MSTIIYWIKNNKKAIAAIIALIASGIAEGLPWEAVVTGVLGLLFPSTYKPADVRKKPGP